ncbi:hypothetical protein [Comamonas testosteroni]|nr:hypothetical protein [Comamonas testosteroni]KWT67832.1 hypothetical protein APV28_3637 [Comamonas testosteroni]
MEEHTELQRQAAKAMGFKVSVKRSDGGLFVTSPQPTDSLQMEP